MRELPTVLSVHVDEGVNGYVIRQWLSAAPNIELGSLRGFDDRLAAHLDGIASAPNDGVQSLVHPLKSWLPGELFVATYVALAKRSREHVEQLLDVVGDVPGKRNEFTYACGWSCPKRLDDVGLRPRSNGKSCVADVAIAAHAMHRLDPGLDAHPWLSDDNLSLRARALRAAGEIGRQDLISTCAAAVSNDDSDSRFWAAWSAVLLGNRGVALDGLCSFAKTISAQHRARAFRLALQAMSVGAGHVVLQDIAKQGDEPRWLIEGSGIVGDARYIPWLIGQMTVADVSRLAGQAFSLITGADLDRLQLFRAQLEDFEGGPTENPEDENVDMDPDEGLMWPDPHRIQTWWDANKHRFQPGQRYFMGAPVTREHCIEVLKNGYQRQRILAAHYLCLLNPGTPLFNTSAPAWRQQKLLAQM